MTTTTAPQIKVLGWTDEVLDCDVCGKPLDRERTLAYTINGDTQYAGTSCAAKIGRTTVSKIRTAANRANREAAAAAQAQQDAIRREVEYAYLTELTERNVTDLKTYNQARDEVYASLRAEGGWAAIKGYISEVHNRMDAR